VEDFGFDPENVFKHIRILSEDIGPRLIGTDGCKQAGEYILSYFRDLGLDVETQNFEAESVSLIHHSVEILEPDFGELRSTPFLFTPDTPEEGLTGQIIFVEEGEEGYLGSQMKGKIVLWSPKTRGIVPRELSQYEPKAVIIISTAPGINPRHDLQHERFFKPYDPVTAFRITWEDGYRLVQSGAKTARVKLKSHRFPSQGRNIIAEVKGSQYPEEIIVICGHYDSPPDTPSATDNASGTAMMMELSQLYARRGSKRTLRFIAFDGEEAGYLGSTHYVRLLKDKDRVQRNNANLTQGLHKTELEKHLFCLNLDWCWVTIPAM
jgi:aminopeptidase YwaD